MDATQDLDEVFIEELNLSPRTIHVLSHAGFFTVSKLKKLLQSNKLKQIYNIGPKSLDEISTALSDLNKNTSEHIKVENKLDDHISSSELDEVFIKKLNLSPRTFHALRRGRVLTVGELKKLLQSKKLEQIKNIGQKSLDEISIALNEFCKNNSALVHDDGLIENDELIENSTDPRQEKPQENIDLVSINILDLNLSIRRALIRSGVKTIGELRYLTDGMLLNITRIGQISLAETQLALASVLAEPWKYIAKHAAKVIKNEKLPFEEYKANLNWAEITQSYFESEKDNYTYILLSRFGFKPKKLEEIASELNVTRERVRQVQEAAIVRFLKYIRLSNSALLLEKIHEILLEHGENLSLKKFKGLLSKENLLGEFSPSLMPERISRIDLFETLICWLNLLSDSKRTQPPVEFPVDIRTLINSDSITIKDSDKLQKIAPKLRRKIKHRVYFTGGINIKEASKILSEDERTTELVLRNLNLKKIENYWYSLKSYDSENDTSKISLRTAGLKMLTVDSEIHLDVFYDGLRKFANRFYSSIAPINVVAHALKLLGFEINDQKIVSTKLIDKNILSRSEKSLVSAISKNKGIASFLEIAEEFFLQGLSLPAVSVTLKRSPIAEKVDDGFYKLRGVEISWQQIDIAKNRQKRYSQDEEISHGLDGIVRVRITINNYAYLTSVVGSHSIKGMTGSWSVIYNNESFGEAKMDETYLWGLPKLFKKLGVQMGDRIELAFNTWDRTLSVGKVNHGST